jgi:beta-mannanase
MQRLVIVVTLVILFLVGGGSTASTAISEAPAAAPVPQTVPLPEVGAYIGAYIGDPPKTDRLQAFKTMMVAFECMTGRRLAIVNRFWAMTTNGEYADFKWLDLADLFADGRILMISWNPSNWDEEQERSTPIYYQDIIEGQLDDVIRSAARDAAEFDHPLFIRWSWEMDGDWYPSNGPNAFGPDGTQSWTETDDLYKYFGDLAKADGPERFVVAWRHIRSIFDEVGADNVIWVWSPNWRSIPDVETAPWNTLTAYYPGDDQVDWIGTSIYFRGDGGNMWLPFRDMFDHTFSGLSIAEFHALHPDKPVMIAEIGAAEKSDDDKAKAEWIEKTYGTEIKAYPYIKAILWFNVFKEEEGIDWRVNSSEASLNAYRTAISDTYYLGQVIECIFLPLIIRS